ncbi:MAG: hypothetical protein V4585_22350 [Bacteroidota bacterium]|jgi:uncharacterized membrane protein
MNIKQIFGTLLTVLGIAALIYAGVIFMDKSVGKTDIKTLILCGVLGSLFFFSGIKLVSSIRDES